MIGSLLGGGSAEPHAALPAVRAGRVPGHRPVELQHRLRRRARWRVVEDAGPEHAVTLAKGGFSGAGYAAFLQVNRRISWSSSSSWPLL